MSTLREAIKGCGITSVNGVKVDDMKHHELTEVISSTDKDIEFYHCIHKYSGLIILDNSRVISELLMTHNILETRDIVRAQTSNVAVCAHIKYIMDNSRINYDYEGCTALVRMYGGYAIKMKYDVSVAKGTLIHGEPEDFWGEGDEEPDDSLIAVPETEDIKNVNPIEADGLIGSLLCRGYEKTPYMPRYYGLFYCDSIPISIMEHIRGMPLFNFLKLKKPHPVIVHSLFIRIILFLYRNFIDYKFVHGDIHSKNILVDNDDSKGDIDVNGIATYGIKPILIDFGGSNVLVDYEDIDQSNSNVTNELQLVKLCRYFNYEFKFSGSRYPEMLEELYQSLKVD